MSRNVATAVCLLENGFNCCWILSPSLSFFFRYCGGFCFIGSRTLLTKHNKIASLARMPARSAGPVYTSFVCLFWFWVFFFLAESKLSANVNGSYGRLDVDQEQQSQPFGCLNAAVIIAKSVYCTADRSSRFIEQLPLTGQAIWWGTYSGILCGSCCRSQYGDNMKRIRKKRFLI